MRHAHAGRGSALVPLAAASLIALCACTRQAAAPGNDTVGSSASNVPAAEAPPAPAPVANDGAAGSNPLTVATAGAPAPYLADSAGVALYALEGDRDGS
jgi:hypothetical protein